MSAAGDTRRARTGRAHICAPALGTPAFLLDGVLSEDDPTEAALADAIAYQLKHRAQPRSSSSTDGSMSYSISKAGSTLQVQRGGMFTPREAEEYLRDLTAAAAAMPKPFVVVVDMRESRAMPQDAAAIVERVPTELFRNGARKIAILQASAIVAMQTQRVTRKEAGQMERVRLFDTIAEAGWERELAAWLAAP